MNPLEVPFLIAQEGMLLISEVGIILTNWSKLDI